MPDRFGQGADYSQTFAYLYDQNLAVQERRAEEADQQREEDQAAKDQQVFDRYNAGKITDEALLAYIRRRISETAYDKSQQANWRQALLQYTESINDARALSQFERTNDYAGYISYLRAKAAGMKGNSAKKAELEQQIQSLIDQRDQNSIAKGADRILLNIQRGKATYDDLLAFYKDRLNTVSDPALKQQIRGQITDITGRIKETDLQNEVAGLGRQLASRAITPQQYGQRLQQIAQRSGYQETNPGQFNAWMQDATQAMNTVQDYGRLEEIDGMLARGDITPQKAMTLYYAEAERYKSIDPAQYFKIRNLGWQVGHQPVEGQTPLPNPGVLGLPDNTQGGVTAVQNARDLAKQFKFMSQIDGTEFGQVNCVYTSAAMLAYAMGYREQGGGAITGGDMRYLSGDRSIGTNLDEAEAALAKLGITGLRNWNDKHMSFEKFKARIGEHGQAGVLMGVNNNLPDSLKAFAGAAKGHGVFIAAYDPKKDAFLWYDPAISKNSHPDYNGVWVDASVVKNFGWGPAYSDGTGSWSFSGQVLLTPPNTIKGRYSATDVKRPPVKYVNVDDIPVRPQTPKTYRGYNNPGPSTRSRVDNPVVDSRGKPRAAKNGRWYTNDKGDLIDTVEEVQAELDKNQARHEILNQFDDAYGKGKDRVTIGGKEYLLTPEMFESLDKERLALYDEDILYAQAAGLDSVINQRTKDRTTFLAAAASRNSLKADTIINTAIRDGLKVFDLANQDPDPMKAQQAARAINGGLKVITAVLKSGQQTDTPLDDLSSDPNDPGSFVNLDALTALMDMVANPATVPMADRITDITGYLAALGADDENHPLNRLTMGIAEQFEAQRKIESGEATPVIDGNTGERGLIPLAPKMDAMTGQETMVPVAQDGDGNPLPLMQVPVQTPTGVEMRWVLIGRSQPIGTALVPTKQNESLKFLKGVPLTGLQISGMDPAVLQQMIASGELQEQPITVPMVQMPPVKRNGRTESGRVFYQDTSTANWWSGVAPIASLGDRNLLLGQYLGVDKNLQPELEWLPYATAGMTALPYQGSRVAIQKAVDEGIITVPQTLPRGKDGNIDPTNGLSGPAFSHPYDPLSSAYTNDPAQRDEDPTERGERIRSAIDQIFRSTKELQDKQDFLVQQGIIDPATPPDLTGQGRPSVIANNGLTAPMPQGEPGFQPGQPIAPGPGFGPQGAGGTTDNRALPDVKSVATDLGINLGGKSGLKGPQLPDNGLKGPQSYTPPAPKKIQQGKRQESGGLPRIGGKQVVVGGTVINVPQSKPSTSAPPRNYTPPPPTRMGTGSAAAASLDILGKKQKQTSKTGNGRYQS